MEPGRKNSPLGPNLLDFSSHHFTSNKDRPWHRPISGHKQSRLNRQLPQLQGWLQEFPQLPREVVILNAQLRAWVSVDRGQCLQSLIVALVAWPLLPWGAEHPGTSLGIGRLQPIQSSITFLRKVDHRSQTNKNSGGLALQPCLA
ncbi:hypothetical protein ASPVEDRAFT_38678 [Aspergillus versicolor CBS 583.65]|uniref:Uncharacterized protein n=1 Tax=Aspergillus versicolor CBS 583.65 TaxID=1036611 RepID=A0A1L9PCI3_ASPVE|nr:uncharacterized protein ASPVEDRAFT_38678 [Aspergillus versicolor CBS 583.65]OJI99211.1 hypothetical protein ASPVEDRAFT_38678 [Aspergillus versicolor CBS 583.65]